MVIERVEVPITPGKEEEFESSLLSFREIFEAAEGCQRFTIARGVESNSNYLLLLEWDTVEHHEAFTETDEFREFRETAGPFFAGTPSMEHFSPVER